MAWGRARFDFDTPLLAEGAVEFPAFDRVIRADRLDEVEGALIELDTACGEGAWAAGWVAYEAAPAFDGALRVHDGCEVPLVWFGLSAQVRPAAPLPPPQVPELHWRLGWDEPTYAAAFDDVLRNIGRGNIYQANLTFPMTATFRGDQDAYYAHLVGAQRADWCALIETDELSVLTASPELFFERDGDRVRTRPMKGTSRRGLTPKADQRLAAGLRASPKERAENLMIVDLLRNDLGRLARPGSVKVPEMFELERYPTVWQMTSSVTAELPAGTALLDLFRALFPCGSVTGAPKNSAMRILAGLEDAPRGVYCGAVGIVMPGNRCAFNVPIRTSVVRDGVVRYHIGSGVVADSKARAEFAECEVKARVLTHRRPPFQLLQTLRFSPELGWTMLDAHLAHLAESADYFDVPVQLSAVIQALNDVADDASGDLRVRLLVGQEGEVAVETASLAGATQAVRRVGLAAEPVDSSDVFLHHKTTHRVVYERARAARPDCDDVLLWNERGELTESTMANLAVMFEETWWTPPVECGLLDGTLRRHLVQCGQLRERVLHREELADAQQVELLNSVRGRWGVELVRAEVELIPVRDGAG